MSITNLEPDGGQDFALDIALDIEDYSGRNFDTDVLDTIVESSHFESARSETAVNSDDILDEEHWTTDSFDELKVDQEY